MNEIKEKLIYFFSQKDLKKSMNILSDILKIIEKNKFESTLVGLIANIIASNENINKKEFIELIKKNKGDINSLYKEILELPYLKIPEIDIGLFFE